MNYQWLWLNFFLPSFVTIMLKIVLIAVNVIDVAHEIEVRMIYLIILAFALSLTTFSLLTLEKTCIIIVSG